MTTLKLKFIRQTIFILIVASVIAACKKKPGEGGKASIKGKIWVENWNTGFTVLNEDYYGTDVDVYIIYGDEINYGDKVSTNYKGEFEFKYLRKGKYTIYTYSKFRTVPAPDGDSAIVNTVEIKDKKENLDLGTITIFD